MSKVPLNFDVGSSFKVRLMTSVTDSYKETDEADNEDTNVVEISPDEMDCFETFTMMVESITGIEQGMQRMFVEEVLKH